MIQLIRKNPALATGILLPVLLVILFSFAALVPKLLVDDPAYDFLFSVKSYSRENDREYKFTVDKEQLKLQSRKVPESKGTGSNSYRLYWYEAATGHAHEITLPSASNGGNGWSSLALPETDGWKISPELIAPDGYSLHNDFRRTSDLGLIFFSGSQRSAIHIVKNGRIVSVTPPTTERNYYTPEFIGWIVERAKKP
jgi:hypothetical protein